MNVWKSENEAYYIIFERNKRVTTAKKGSLDCHIESLFPFLNVLRIYSKRDTKKWNNKQIIYVIRIINDLPLCLLLSHIYSFWGVYCIESLGAVRSDKGISYEKPQRDWQKNINNNNSHANCSRFRSFTPNNVIHSTDFEATQNIIMAVNKKGVNNPLTTNHLVQMLNLHAIRKPKQTNTNEVTLAGIWLAQRQPEKANRVGNHHHDICCVLKLDIQKNVQISISEALIWESCVCVWQVLSFLFHSFVHPVSLSLGCSNNIIGFACFIPNLDFRFYLRNTTHNALRLLFRYTHSLHFVLFRLFYCPNVVFSVSDDLNASDLLTYFSYTRE